MQNTWLGLAGVGPKHDAEVTAVYKIRGRNGGRSVENLGLKWRCVQNTLHIPCHWFTKYALRVYLRRHSIMQQGPLIVVGFLYEFSR